MAQKQFGVSQASAILWTADPSLKAPPLGNEEARLLAVQKVPLADPGVTSGLLGEPE